MGKANRTRKTKHQDIDNSEAATRALQLVFLAINKYGKDKTLEALSKIVTPLAMDEDKMEDYWKTLLFDLGSYRVATEFTLSGSRDINKKEDAVMYHEFVQIKFKEWGLEDILKKGM